MNLYNNEPVYISVDKYKKVKIPHLKEVSFLAFAISVISYFFIIYQSPIFPNQVSIFALYFYQFSPLMISTFCFMLTIGFFLYSLNVVAKKRRLSFWQALIIAFVFINPFTLKAILTPMENISYALCVFVSYRLYLLFQKETKDSRYVTLILLLACSLFFKNTLPVFSQIAVMDFLYHIFTSRSDKNKSAGETLALVSVTCLISAFFYNMTFDSLSDNISLFFTTFVSVLNSVWIAFLMIGIIGFVAWTAKSVKAVNFRFLFVAPLISLIIISCYFPDERIFNTPFLVAMLIFSFTQIENISKVYGIVMSSALMILFSSTYFTVINNHRIQSLFVNNLNNSLQKEMIKDEFYLLLGDLPASPVIKDSNLYPPLFWNSFYFNRNAWLYDQKSHGYIFTQGSQESINTLGMDYYLKKPLNDTKYYRIINKNSINYVILNGKNR